MRQLFKKSLVIISVSVALWGCFEAPNYSPTPEIEFNNIDKFTVIDAFSGPTARRDSVIVTVDFRDGDGDLGETVVGRTNGKYDTWGNYEIRTFALINNKFEEVTLAANSKIFFPDLKPDGKKGPIEGKLDYFFYFPYSRTSKNTVVKFRIRVRDRAMNVSNAIETDTISVPLIR